VTESRFEVLSASLAQFTRALQKLKARVMTPYGLRSTHVTCLFPLSHAPRGMTAAEVSEVSELDKGAVSRAIAELERLGYVICERSDDKRKYRARITLTESGEYVAERVAGAIDETIARAGKSLPPEELAAFYRALPVMAKALETILDE